MPNLVKIILASAALLIFLKLAGLTNIATWSWWWITFPIWGYLVLVVAEDLFREAVHAVYLRKRMKPGDKVEFTNIANQQTHCKVEEVKGDKVLVSISRSTNLTWVEKDHLYYW